MFCLTYKVFAAHTAPLPWVLAKDDDGSKEGPVARYVKNLGKEDRNAVIELDQSLPVLWSEQKKLLNME